MVRLNVKTNYDHIRTHEGAPAYPHMTDEQALRRSVLSCLLWENEFYEDGEDIAARISKLADKVSVAKLADLATEARGKYHLRSVPMLLLAKLAGRAQGSSLVSDTLERTITRADELAEFLAVYAKVNGVGPDKLKGKLSAQVKKGLARAFQKFDAYALGKYNRDNAIKLRDVLFMCHAKPANDDQAALWKRLVDGTLESPDTWEVNLSAGADKRETFERLIREEKLGYLALLRNLRNMAEAGCDETLVRDAIIARRGAHRVLPFRYVAAARACPRFEPAIDQAICASIADAPRLVGKTAVLVDVSGSMDDRLSAKSDLKRIDAAAALASVINGDLRVFTFSTGVVEVPPRRGMSGVDAILRSQPHQGTYLGQAVQAVAAQVPFDRLIVITDEQSHDRVTAPKGRCYMINVASARNGVGYGPWVHLDGFSEHVIRWIMELESAGSAAAR